MRLARGTFIAGAAGALACAAAAAPARAAIPLRVVFFPGLDAWPLYVARDRGLFAREGLDVALTPTAGSVSQIAKLMAGEFDVASTAFDNLVAYDAGEGDPSVTGPFDLVAFLGGAEATNKLVARPEIRSYADLRGKTLAVDAVATGYSFVLRKMLALQGLGESDYRLVEVGNTEKRFAAMTAGTAVAAIVGIPFDLIGESRGFHVLGDALTALGGHYQATCSIARRSWGDAHRDAIAGYARAYRAALDWLFEPANRAEALAILVRATKLPEALAARSAPALLDPRTGFRRDAGFDEAGIATVLALRSAYAAPKKSLGAPRTYLASWVV